MPRTMFPACFTLFFRASADAEVRALIGYNDVNTRLDGRACGMKSAIRPNGQVNCALPQCSKMRFLALTRLVAFVSSPDPENSTSKRVHMSFNNVPAGKDLPQDFNVIIEIPAQSDPVKYEADKDMGLLVVDRFIGTGMRYPANYGFIPQTLSGDGDPVDVLVITPFPLLAGSVVRARALGMLQMTDESGVDAKLVAVAHDKICPMTAHMKTIDDVPDYLKDQIKHFFEQYKALEKGKWVKVEGWQGVDAAHKEITEGVANFKK
jgi:inorganic pyrophosphatase